MQSSSEESKPHDFSAFLGMSARTEALVSLSLLHKLFLNLQIEQWLGKYRQRGEIESGLEEA